MADDDLAYGEYHGQGEGETGERGFLGDAYKRFAKKRPQDSQQSVPYLSAICAMQ